MRILTKILVLSLVFSLFSCLDGRKLKGYHAGIIPPDSMIDILLEVQLIESYRNLKYIQNAGDSMHQDRSRLFYEQIFSKFNVSAERFDSSFAYYQNQDPIVLDEMYGKINEKLSQQLSEQK